jgi:ADP-ribose pyrophosphatase
MEEQMIKPWRRVQSQPGQSYRIFSVRTDRAVSPRTATEHDFYIIETRNWVNVIPITADHQVVMVRQYRHGSREVTLEIPGGLVDDDDTPQKAAMRELQEETGYRAEEMLQIGNLNPNPAIFANRVYTYVAQNLRKVGDPSPDQTEDIEVVLIPLSEIKELIRKGTIDHAIVVAAFCLLFKIPPPLGAATSAEML